MKKKGEKKCRDIPSLWLQELKQQSGHGNPPQRKFVLICAYRTNVRHDV